MVEFLRQYRKNVVALAILILVLIILFLVNIVLGNKKDPLKKVQNYDYVYTLEKNKSKSSSKSSYLPQINLRFHSIDMVNEEIMELYYQVLEEEKSEFTYEYSQKGDLLFLLIRVYFYDESNQGMETRYLSYVIEMQDGSLLSNQEALVSLGYPEDSIWRTLRNKMYTYYENAVKEGYIPEQECDFNCYLKWRDMVNIDEGASLFFKNGHLVLYRGFSLQSIYEDKAIFGNDPFIFELEK